MKSLCFTLLITGISLNASAVGRLVDVSIVDRTSGEELSSHFYKGEYWVVGTPGARYSILIRNSLGEQHYEVTGWRKSDAEVAAFEFTALPNSYAARTGRPENVGVIGVALFRERAAPESASYARAFKSQDAPSPAPALPAPALESGRLLAGALGAGVPQSLGTGHGELEYSHIHHVDFERLSSTPEEVIRIRYDSLENLVAMGVVQHWQRALARPDPFPESPLARYVPDPPDSR
ncbi:MAG: hypothetical protein ABSE43_07060 [Steroidobacteraceae bacterium]